MHFFISLLTEDINALYLLPKVMSDSENDLVRTSITSESLE